MAASHPFANIDTGFVAAAALDNLYFTDLFFSKKYLSASDGDRVGRDIAKSAEAHFFLLCLKTML